MKNMRETFLILVQKPEKIKIDRPFNGNHGEPDYQQVMQSYTFVKFLNT